MLQRHHTVYIVRGAFTGPLQRRIGGSAVLAVLIEKLAHLLGLILRKVAGVHVASYEVLGFLGGDPRCLRDHRCEKSGRLRVIHGGGLQDLVHVVLERIDLMRIEHRLLLHGFLGLGSGLVLGVAVGPLSGNPPSRGLIPDSHAHAVLVVRQIMSPVKNETCILVLKTCFTRSPMEAQANQKVKRVFKRFSIRGIAADQDVLTRRRP